MPTDSIKTTPILINTFGLTLWYEDQALFGACKPIKYLDELLNESKRQKEAKAPTGQSADTIEQDSGVESTAAAATTTTEIGNAEGRLCDETDQEEKRNTRDPASSEPESNTSAVTSSSEPL